MAALRRLVKSIGRFLSPEDALKEQAAVSPEGPVLQFESSRSFGGGHLLDAMWRQLGLDHAVKKSLGDRDFKTPVERVIFAMVANRALAPCSKLAIEEWVANDVVLPGVETVEVQQLYRAMDALIVCGPHLQKEVYFSVADLLNLEVDLLFLDTTSTYFETEGEDPEEEDNKDYYLRQRGHSKDHRPDLAQIVIGLAVTRQGIPIRCWVWPGNKVDVATIEEVKRDLIGWKLGRVVTVVDRGFMSEDNLRELQRAGGHYIAGEKMRNNKEGAEEVLSRAGRYKQVKHNIEVKEIILGNGEARERYILARNPDRVTWDREKREDILRCLKLELDRVRAMKKPERSKAMYKLVAHSAYGRYLKINAKGLPELDNAKIKAEERLDGKYILRTSDDTLTAADVALGYKQLLEVEAAFRTLKQTLELRPVYHRLSRRIEAHVILCWLALLLIRVVEVKVEENLKQVITWDSLRRELDRLHLGVFTGPAGVIHQRTELRPLQEQIFKAVGVKPPQRILQIGETPTGEDADM
jgi:transposase